MKIKYRTIRLVAGLALISAGTWVTATPADAAPAWRHLKNLAYGQCIEVASENVNAALRIAPCRDTPAQQWAPVVTSGGRIFQVNQWTGYCAEVNQGTSVPGERVYAYYCNGTLSEQWIRQLRIGGLAFINAGSQMCLDTVAGANSNLMQWYCEGTDVQTWVAV